MRTLRTTGARIGSIAVFSASLACILFNPSYDDPTGSMSGTGTTTGTTGSSTAATTFGESEGGKCDGDCRYLDPPPIACYEFEELSALVDSRNCGLDGDLSGVEAAPGVVKMGARVDKSSEITVPGGRLPELPQLTFTAWIAIPNKPDDELLVIDKAQHVVARLIPPPDGQPNWVVSCTVGANKISAEQAVLSANGKWHMLACGCDPVDDDPTVCAPFTGLDGARVQGDPPWLTRPLSNDAPIEIAPSYKGCIDSIQLWDRALTEDELTALYDQGIVMMPEPCDG